MIMLTIVSLRRHDDVAHDCARCDEVVITLIVTLAIVGLRVRRNVCLYYNLGERGDNVDDRHGDD